MDSELDVLERGALAFCLAARLTAWPDDETLREAKVLAEGLEDGGSPERALISIAAHAERARYEPEYLTLFENGPRRCPVHETEYGRMRGMAKGNELADIAGFYTAFGMTRADGDAARQLSDHLAVELEFYGTLLAKQAALLEAGDGEGGSIVLDARRKFLGDHLGRLTNAISSQPSVQGSPVYGPLLASTHALVQAECNALSVTPAPMDFLPEQAESEVMCCAT
ncbi:MAG: molecular chaperone TorD family protein [Archangium sp.]|nr:molecular chaperone TorD family protein [Archangium sp.]